MVGRCVSLAASRIAGELEVSARTLDGEVTGVRHRTYPIEGLRFHPESMLTPTRPAMLRTFLDALRCGPYDGRTVAVTVEGMPVVVLDERYHIVEVNDAARPNVGPLVGESAMDAFPGASTLFLPQLERARATGECVDFVEYFNGYVVRIVATPNGGTLTISWETLAILDVVTLDGLRASIDEALNRLAGVEQDLRRRHVRDSLHVLEGGA